MKLGVVFRKVSQRRLVISFLGQHGSGCTTLVRSPESGSPICSQQMNPLLVDSQSTGAPQKSPPRRSFPPHRFRPSTTTSATLASQFDRRVASGHCGRLSCQATRPLFLKIAPAPCRRGFVFPATGNLGCLSGQRAGNFRCLFQGSVKDARLQSRSFMPASG